MAMPALQNSDTANAARAASAGFILANSRGVCEAQLHR
jgi:hypothetical protein